MNLSIHCFTILACSMICSGCRKSDDATRKGATGGEALLPSLVLIDLNGNGSLEPQEINYATKSLMRADVDADGTLTIAEARQRSNQLSGRRSGYPYSEAGRQEAVWGP